jgi:hypothetical protein
MRPQELADYVTTKDRLSVLSAPGRRGCGWYVCKLVEVEVHDTGSHGDSLLVWTNSHLIRATDAESAYRIAVELGAKWAFEVGTHRCDTDNAHWEFLGLRDLIGTLGPPSDGGVLWFEESNISLEQKFEWDEAKNRRNLAKHGLRFEDAEPVFSGPCVTFEDDRFDYGEERLVTLGLLAGRLVVVRPLAARWGDAHHLREKGNPT